MKLDFKAFLAGALFVVVILWFVLNGLITVSGLPQGQLSKGIETLHNEAAPAVNALISNVFVIVVFCALLYLGFKWLNKKS